MSNMLDRMRVLPHYAAANYKVLQKTGGPTELRYMPLQRRIHAAAELQLEEQGEIRQVLVKPRQIRSSTYWMSVGHYEMYEFPGTRALTVTHKGATTDELFSTVKAFQDNMPDDLKIKHVKDNEEVLELTNQSKMKVATAGSDGARGFPCRFFVWSEVGRCTGRQVKDVQEGAFQTLATGKDTVGVLESTSGGSGNYFHEVAKEGLVKGQRWRTLFYSVWEEPEYRLTPPKDWEPSDDEIELAKHFKLDFAQLYWRFDKLKFEFMGSVSAFNREYPATFDMAFEEAGGKLIDSMAILKARKSLLQADRMMPVIMGVDPAGKGDRTVIVIRQGNVVLKHYVFRTMDDATLDGIVNRYLNEWDVHTCFVDMGYGHGNVSRLRDIGRYNVVGVHFGAKATKPELYRNKRTEMAADVKEWVEQGENNQGGLVKIPDDEEFAADIAAIPELQFSGSKGQFYLPSKDEIKEELHKSTDIFDALCLTFAYPVKGKNAASLILPNQFQSPKSLLTTQNTFNELQGNDSQGNIGWNEKTRYFSFGGFDS